MIFIDKYLFIELSMDTNKTYFLHVQCMSQIEFRSLIQIEIGRKGTGNNKAQDA